MTLDLKNLGPSRDASDLLTFNKFLLFGASGGATEVERFLMKRGKSIIGYVDNSPQKQGTPFNGLTIHSPQDIPQLLDDETAIIISSAYQVEIAKQLTEELGLSIRRVFPFISEMFHHHFGKSAIAPYQAQIEHLLDTLADEESAEYVSKLVRFRWTMDPRTLHANPSLKGFYEYTPGAVSDALGPHRGDRIIDCGAFNGDTARAFLSRLNNDCDIIAIEPLGSNFDALNKWIDDSDMAARVTPLKIGVGDKASTMRIESSAASEDPRATIAHANDDSTTEEITIETLDSIVNGPSPKVDYVKIDIEGFEPEALNGARSLLTSHQPDLAIAGYHVAEHLWELPNLIQRIEPSYKIYVGHHPAAPYECEFFCTARQTEKKRAAAC